MRGAENIRSRVQFEHSVFIFISGAKRDGEVAFVFVDVESDPAENFFFEEAEQIVGRREFSAGDVDEQRAGFCFGKLLVIEEPSVFVGEIHRAGDDVRFANFFVELHVVDKVVFLNGVVAEHRHVEALSDTNDFATDISDAGDEQGFTCDFAPGDSVAVKGFELFKLCGEFPAECRPEEHSLFGDTAGAIEGQVSAGGAGGVAVAVGGEVVVAGTTAEQGIDFLRPVIGDLRLSAQADDARGRLWRVVFLNRLVGEARADGFGQGGGDSGRLFFKGFVKEYVGCFNVWVCITRVSQKRLGTAFLQALIVSTKTVFSCV